MGGGNFLGKGGAGDVRNTYSRPLCREGGGSSVRSGGVSLLTNNYQVNLLTVESEENEA